MSFWSVSAKYSTLGAVDVVADEPAEVVAADAEHDRGQRLKPISRARAAATSTAAALTVLLSLIRRAWRVGEVAWSRTAAGTC